MRCAKKKKGRKKGGASYVVQRKESGQEGLQPFLSSFSFPRVGFLYDSLPSERTCKGFLLEGLLWDCFGIAVGWRLTGIVVMK